MWTAAGKAEAQVDRSLLRERARKHASSIAIRADRARRTRVADREAISADRLAQLGESGRGRLNPGFALRPERRAVFGERRLPNGDSILHARAGAGVAGRLAERGIAP